MANKLILKNGAGIPAPEKLEVAELALDTVDGSLYSKLGDGSVVQLNDDAGGGASVHIGEAPPVDPQEGQQWLETPTSGDAKMWVYDGAVWLEQPSKIGAGGGGGGITGEYHGPDNPFMDVYWKQGTEYWNGITNGYVLYNPDGQSYGLEIYHEGTLYVENIDCHGFQCDSNIEAAGVTVNAIVFKDLDAYIMADDYEEGVLAFELNGTAQIKFKPGGIIQAADFLDAEGNSIIGAGGEGDSYWLKGDVLSPQLERIGANYSLDAFTSARVFYASIENETVQLFVDKAEVTGTVQAADFLDANGNSIIGAGGGAEAIEATFYESVQLRPTSEDTGSNTREYNNVWVVDDRNGVDDQPDQRTNIYSAGQLTAYTLDAGTVRAYACNLDGAGTGLKTPSIVSGRIATVEHTVLGGINIPAADEERPDELPYSPDEKSIQYAFTVTHETLGRTVEIDKEGIIRANQFTDMEGNPIGGVPDKIINEEHNFGLDLKPVLNGQGIQFYKSLVPISASGEWDDRVSVGSGSGNGTNMGLAFYDGHFSNAVYVKGSPVTTTRIMVNAFTTLQKAIADEDTLEGVKSALTNSLGGLIEKFEAMNND